VSASQTFILILLTVRWEKYCGQHVCMFVCRSVCLYTHILSKTQISPNFLYMLPRSSCDNNAIRYIFLVLWMTSCFIEFARWRHQGQSLLFLSGSCYCYCMYVRRAACANSICVCVSAGGQLPSPSYTAEKAEQTQQLPLSMDHLLGMLLQPCSFQGIANSAIFTFWFLCVTVIS